MGICARASIVLAAVTAAAGAAGAQPAERTKVYEFDGDGLDGKLARPDGEIITVAPDRLRQFDPASGPGRIAALDRALAGAAPDRPARAEQFLELAGLLAGQAYRERVLAIEAEVGRDRARDPARRRDLEAAARRHGAAQARAQQRAIAIYTEVVCEAGDRARGLDCAPRAALRAWPRMHEALFELAYLLDVAGRGADAIKVHRRLVADHPQSRYAAHALLALAERAFEEARLPDAEALYVRVLASKATALHGYARYKTGWVQLNLSRDAEAFASFAAVIAGAGKDPRGALLAREARKDLVRAYAVSGTAADAFARLDRAAPGHGVELLHRLAELWLEQGKASDAVAVYAELQRRASADPRVCDWQAGLVSGALMLGDRPRQIAEVTRLAATLRRVRAMKGVARDALKRCAEGAASTIATLATVWHKEAMTTHGAQLRDDADRLYALYLQEFPAAADAGTMRYYHAELTWLRAEGEKDQPKATALWELAAERHTRVVEDERADEKIRRDSAHAAVLAWKNALAVDPRVAAPAEAESSPGPRPIPPRERKMLAAFQNYAKMVKDPKDPDLVTMKFLSARVYWRHDHMADAIRLFEEILTDHLDHEVAEYAANLLLDTLNRKGDYKAMLAWVDRLLGQTAFLAGKAELHERLSMIRRQGTRKRAEELARDGKYADCGTAYLELHNAAPGDPEADELLYNAGVCHEQAGLVGAALVSFKTIVQRHGNRPLAQRALARAGHLHARVAQYREAAELLEQYARRYGGEKDAVDAISDAAYYYRAAGDHARAVAATQLFIKQYGRKLPARAAEAAFALAGMHEAAGDQPQAAAALQSYLRDWGRAGGVDREIAAHVKLGMLEWRRSCKLPHLVDGACVEVRRVPAAPAGRPPTHCAPGAVRIVVGPRDAALARSARAHFQAAIDLNARAASSSLPEHRLRTMQAQVAAAEWHLAEADYERYLAIPFPAGLDFDARRPAVKQASVKRFQQWLTGKADAMKALAGDPGTYTRIAENEAAGDWRLAAAARVGLAATALADQLRSAAIPAVVRTGEFVPEKIEAYCKTLSRAGEPLPHRAGNYHDFCLDIASRTSSWNDWAATCARELRRLRPADAPPRERHGAADRLAPVTDLEPPARPR